MHIITVYLPPAPASDGSTALHFIGRHSFDFFERMEWKEKWEVNTEVNIRNAAGLKVQNRWEKLRRPSIGRRVEWYQT